MSWSNYWGALSSRQRLGLAAGAVCIVVLTAGLAVWVWRDPYVPLASGLSSERLDEVVQELERAKLEYRVEPGAEVVSVPSSQLGRARATAAGGQFATPPSVGLELFKEVDFSSTDFAQRINYQRALQGELTRTIQAMAGVRSARVHVILADGGLFKRNASKSSAAVSVAMRSGERLNRAQIGGIQHLVIASVPEIKAEDVVVLDESGNTLTGAAEAGEAGLSSTQLDLKRQADEYLEHKVARLLREVVPNGSVSLSVDATLDYQQLRVTTEEPIAVRGAATGARAAGVLVKERQWQGAGDTELLQTADYAPERAASGSNWEYQYQVGHRMEQTLSTPGSIKRLSVAVALQGAPAGLTTEQAENLVAHAIGLESARGDSVVVLLLPAPRSAVALEAVRAPPSPTLAASERASEPLLSKSRVLKIAIAALLAAAALWLLLRRPAAEQRLSAQETEALAAKVRQWLGEGANHGNP